MKTFNHFVVMSHGNAGLNYVLPWSGGGDRELPPQRMVQWNCAGPCLIGWGRNIVPHKALPDDVFAASGVAPSAGPLGRWFRKRREATY